MTINVTLKIEGMECPNCALKLECIEDRLAGITSAEASYHKAQLKLEYNEAKVSMQQISAEVAKIGFKVVLIENQSPQK